MAPICVRTNRFVSCPGIPKSRAAGGFSEARACLNSVALHQVRGAGPQARGHQTFEDQIGVSAPSAFSRPQPTSFTRTHSHTPDPQALLVLSPESTRKLVGASLRLRVTEVLRQDLEVGGVIDGACKSA